ncbi:hypothetical protein [Amycolatopsis sp. 195334CR]|uniref:hypothetical protein n=1 Tax=Amycolatopsis sp. 195334CR TaxID=2814588 RepID=UPI001A8F8982|nr:hypothetical protein [Amycolatopsis sp. 195334CR]MBN6040588.1 hypothetical protein [Amycolatopsis sp. 195334CR]
MSGSGKRGRTGMAIAGVVVSLVLTTRETEPGQPGVSGPAAAEVVVAECLGAFTKLARAVFLLAAAAPER